MAKDQPQPKKRKEAAFYDATFSIEAIQHEPYEGGFTWRTVIGAFFVAFVMMPGMIFMGLMIGTDMGDAADWVVIILFVEVARRSFISLRKQELYILKYTVSHLTTFMGGLALGGGVFAHLVYQRYLRASEAFTNFGIDWQIPDWVAPPKTGDLIYQPFIDPVWYPVIAVLVLSMLLSKLTQLSLGFLAYKVTSDVEKLPFPLAPIHAEGAIALAETSQDKNQKGYRQYCFSVGVVAGAVFGMLYVAIPILSQAFLGQTIQLLPIPFWDLTTDISTVLPAATLGISLNLGLLLTGFVLPWRIVLGMFVTSIAFQLVINPILQVNGLLPSWSPGADAIETHVAATLDVYLSIGIGTSLAIAVVGIYGITRALITYKRQLNDSSAEAPAIDIRKLWQRDRERGDPPTWVALAVWLGASAGFVGLSDYLINQHSGIAGLDDQFPIFWLILFAFVWTPLNTYINARMSGIAGQHAGIPFVKEAAIFISGYRRVDIWFAPLPIQNFGSMADRLRETQLTRTRFTSILWAELLIFPLMLVASFIFWSYISGLGPIPSDNYPYVQKFWPQFAQLQAVWASGLQEGDSKLLQSLKPEVIGMSLIGTLMAFSGFSLGGISSQYIYGGIGAINSYPHVTMPVFAGAVLGRYVLAKKFGREQWTNFAPILAVGFGAGMGLTGMLSIALNFLWVSIGAGY